MNLLEIQTEVADIVTACQYSASSTDITKYINQGLQYVAGEVRLRSLEKKDTITVTSGTATLPTDKIEKHPLVRVMLPDGTKLDQYDTFNGFEEKKLHLTDSGDPEIYYSSGVTLYVSPVPTSKVLTVIYYKTPDTLVNSTDIPEGIPAHLHSQVLVNYAARQIFGLNNELKRYGSHDYLFNVGVSGLKADEPTKYDEYEVIDKSDYIT